GNPNGRKARDTFASLKKTCRKLDVSFWDFLYDRLTGNNNISYLPELLSRKLTSKLLRSYGTFS
ncbi:MAG: hypothetical protein AAF620_16355, partial [Bacteroidota bacterium]